METFSNVVAQINSFVWGPWMLALLVGTGILLTIRLKFLQFFSLPLPCEGAVLGG